MAKSPYSPEWRAMIAQRYLDSEGSFRSIAAEIGLDPCTIREWARRYAANGKAAAEMNGKTVRVFSIFTRST